MCNATTVGIQWDISCAGNGYGYAGFTNESSTVSSASDDDENPHPPMVETKTDLVNTSGVLDPNGLASCPSWYLQATNTFVAFSVLVLFVGVMRHVIWKLEDALHLREHHYDDWVKLWIV